jgi:hypothetical protein
MKWLSRTAALMCLLAGTGDALAQEIPAEYQAVLTTLEKTGDFAGNVLKVNIPRSDLRVTINQRPAPTPFGFGGWVALTKGNGGTEVMMGDLVLTEDEVNPVMSAILDNGLDVTALHNHFFWEQPRVFYLHVHGTGSAADLARRLKPAIDLIDQAVRRAQPSGTAGQPEMDRTITSGLRRVSRAASLPLLAAVTTAIVAHGQVRVETLVGTGQAGRTDGDARTGQLNRPHGLAVDAQGNVYVSDRGSHSSDHSVRAHTAAAGPAIRLGSRHRCAIWPHAAARTLRHAVPRLRHR